MSRPVPNVPPPGAELGHGPDASAWSVMLRLLGLAWHFRAACLGLLALNLAVLALGLCGLGLTGLGIDAIRFGIDPSAPRPHWPGGWSPPASWSDLNVVSLIGVLILVMGLLMAALAYASSVTVGSLVQRRIVPRLRNQVYNKLQRLSFGFFDANSSGSVINRVTSDCAMVARFINGVMMQSITLLLSLGVYLVYMLSIHQGLTAACLATTPILALVTFRFGRTVKPAYRENRKLVDEMILNLSESVQGVHVIKGFAGQAEAIDRFGAANDRVMEHKRGIFQKVSLYHPRVIFLTQVNLVILLIYGGWLVIQESRIPGSGIALGTGLIVFAGLLTQFSNQISMIANITNTIQISVTSAQRVFEVLDAPLQIQSAPDAVRLPQPRGAVEFDHVNFEYKTGEPVLHDIHFDAPPGSCVGIVGATGSGKTTLLSLISRFYDPTRGQVRIDGIDARTLDLDDLRRSIGVVFQESFLFSNSIEANIAFGHPEATHLQVEQAARIACAHEFIEQLPHGYDTIIGEQGNDLSGGQRQRLAIARAILLEPPILILDDATAAIDPETEQDILTAMENATKGRTTFVVAHRISTLRRVDQVLVLEKGRVVQAGTHDQLMITRGQYRRAAKLQIADAESRRILGMPESEAPGMTVAAGIKGQDGSVS